MLSVVTYTYNDHGFALETLRRLERHQAVVGQVVVVDDGSAEPFAAPRGPLSGRLTVARHPANQGPGLAKRTGLALASGPLILSVDSDIEWDALWFYSALERVREPDVGIVGAPIVEKNHGDSLSAALHFASLARLGQARDAGFARGGIWLTRKDVLDAVGGLGDYGRATHEDWHLCRKVRERGLRVVVNDRGTVLQTRRIGRSQCVRRDALYLADGYAGLIAREEPAALLSVLTLELEEALAVAQKGDCPLLVYLKIATCAAVFARWEGRFGGHGVAAAVAEAFAPYPEIVRAVVADCGLSLPAAGQEPGALAEIFRYVAEIVGQARLRRLDDAVLPQALAEEAAGRRDFHFMD